MVYLSDVSKPCNKLTNHRGKDQVHYSTHSHSSFHGFYEGKSLYKHVISQEYGFKETDFCHCLWNSSLSRQRQWDLVLQRAQKWFFAGFGPVLNRKQLTSKLFFTGGSLVDSFRQATRSLVHLGVTEWFSWFLWIPWETSQLSEVFFLNFINLIFDNFHNSKKTMSTHLRIWVYDTGIE